ncbi:gp37 [Streptomyces phage phiSASD1]|uniref:Gp37 n=1 Tax=Streptomyces phage phiSASD1 TaxID=747763 RepID=D7NW63_9CAUD|nr:gp37 [Streptomyces phage phiSASD1]ADE43461.1 gp37 [Streptomyces phage phiSASD1]
MSTLASLTVRLGIDNDEVTSGARRSIAAIRSIGASTAGMTQDADGNWRSLDGRVLSSTHAMMTNGQRMRDALGGVRTVMRSLGTTASTQMANGMRTAGKAGVATLGGLTKTLAATSAVSIGAAGALAAVPLAVVGLGVKAASQTKEVQTAFTGLKDHVTKTMASLAKPMVQPLVDASKQIRGIFDDLAPQLGQLFKAAAPMIKPLVQGLGGLVNGLVKGLVPVMEQAGPLVESLGALFTTLGDGLAGFSNGLVGGIGAVAGVFDGLGTVIGTLLPVLGTLMGQILRVAGPILGKLLTGLGPVIQALGDALMPVIAALGPVLDALVDAVLALLQAVIPLLPVVAQLIVALLPALTPILLALVPLFQALAEVVAALIPILVPIIRLVAFLAAALGNGLALIITSILVPAVRAIAALLRGDFGGALDYAKQALSGAAAFVKLIFVKLPAALLAALAPLGPALWAMTKAAGQRMIVAIRAKAGEFVSYMKTLPGKAKSALSGIGGILVSAGKSLIAGFIRGIASQFSAVKSKLSSLTSALPDWKGPANLDRKILTPAGRMVISGFQKGIDAQAPLLRRQLQGLTSDLPGMAMDVSPKGVMSAALSQGQTVTFDVTGADEDMKRLIRRIVSNDGRGDVQTAFGRR